MHKWVHVMKSKSLWCFNKAVSMKSTYVFNQLSLMLLLLLHLCIHDVGNRWIERQGKHQHQLSRWNKWWRDGSFRSCMDFLFLWLFLFDFWSLSTEFHSRNTQKWIKGIRLGLFISMLGVLTSKSAIRVLTRNIFSPRNSHRKALIRYDDDT